MLTPDMAEILKPASRGNVAWYEEAADRMVREGTPFRQVAAEKGYALTMIECEQIVNSKLFQDILWTARHRYNQDVGGNPEATKTSAAGMMLQAIQKLLDDGQWDKAIQGVEKLSKLQGWQGGDTQVNVFADLTARDFDKIRNVLAGKKVEKKVPEAGPDPSAN